MRFKDTQTLIEQLALLFVSFIWTTIVLVAIIFFWAYNDVQARWEFVLTAPPEALAQAPATATPSPTATAWAGPGATVTPTPTSPPTAIPTAVINMPEMLPETFNADEPVPVIVHTEDEAAEFGVNQQPQPEDVLANALPTATPAPAPVEQASPSTDVERSQVSIPPAQSSSAQPAVAEINNHIPTGVIPSRLIINSIGLDSEIIPVGWSVVQKDGFEYSIWQVADYAVGWHKTSAPLGQPGNTVMAGHHNVNGEVFRDLVNVEVGDKITIYSGGNKYEYMVDLKTIVKEKGESVENRKRNAQWIAPTEDERITLVTCWPYTNNTHRVIVVARPL